MEARLIHTQTQFIEALRRQTPQIGNFQEFKSLCFHLQNLGGLSIRHVEADAIGAWHNFAYFKIRRNGKEREHYFFLSSSPYFAIGSLREEDFRKFEKGILMEQNHGFVTSLNFPPVEEVLSETQLSALQSYPILLLSPQLLREKPSPEFKAIAREESLVSKDIWPWKPENYGQILFNWWDD